MPSEPVCSVTKHNLTIKEKKKSHFESCVIFVELSTKNIWKKEKGKIIRNKASSEMLLYIDTAIKAKHQKEFRFKKVMLH